VRRARARQAGDDDRPLDHFFVYLGMLLEIILDQQAVGRIAHCVAEQEHAFQRVGAGVAVPFVDQQPQPLVEILGAEIGKAGGVARRIEHRFLGKLHGIRLGVFDRLALRMGQLRVEQVGDLDFLGHRVPRWMTPDRSLCGMQRICRKGSRD
jgi:hypothetical protein